MGLLTWMLDKVRALLGLLLPLAGKILAALHEGLVTWFPDTPLAIDLDRVPALAEDREKLWAQVSAADFLSADEKRALYAGTAAKFYGMEHLLN